MGSVGIEETPYDIVVVGGGFCGVYQLQHLRKLGFKTRLFEAGGGLGGIWYWNAYPGSRVDTAVPTYQLWDDEAWATFDWKQKFPGRDELREYFIHVDKTWDLSKDISFNSRITSMQWEGDTSRWHCEINDGASRCTAWSVVLCTGFASKRFIPDFKNLGAYKGVVHHTGLWPQCGVDLVDKRVAVIGTGASGVQLIQETAKVASQITVYQRTPNTALPMENPDISAASNTEMRSAFSETMKTMATTFAGFDYEFVKGKPADVPYEERMKLYERLYSTGGLHFWLGTYMDVLFEEEPNEEAYQYWRKRTIARIKDPKAAEILAPRKKIHPFGTKRVSLEQEYFEVFNQDNAEIVSLRETPIEEFVETGIKTSDGKTREFDIIALATGFDSITGGITQMNIRGVEGTSIAEKWKDGTYTQLGMTTSGFPNLFFTYGPQAPTAFATGPSSAETQGSWIVECLRYMRERDINSIDATREAEVEWRKHVNEVADKTLFPQADSWYFGANIPGKPREALNYMGGLPTYKKKCWDSANDNYAGFTMVSAH